MTAIDSTLAALRRGDLAGAHTLTLRGGLREFPPEIMGLADTLEVLDLSQNALSVLPDDLGRLSRLRVLFCSGNRFDRLPPVLGDCVALSQIGFRDAGLGEIPAEALPPKLRWLTVTGNVLRDLPRAIGERPLLQKLMLSGNQLSELPVSLAGAPSLELLRLSANRFESLPPWIAELPCMAWLAWAGNPMDAARAQDARSIPWDRLALTGQLGEGASGQVFRADWQDGAESRPVALKLFRGAMTSDGLPEREMEACLMAGDHPNLAGGLGRVTGHPDGAQGLAMRLLPEGWRALAGPPSLESCTRDVYAPDAAFTAETVLRLAYAVACAGAHLHATDLSHGDLYAHNTLWDGAQGDAVLSDFGASAALPPPGPLRRALEGMDVLAWAILVEELLARCPGLEAVDAIRADCLDRNSSSRPRFADIVEELRPLVAVSLHSPSR
ncbi:leucine-rich repeat-containing serine/threonine-protein kinase [Acetobacteraceae bacterium KSS8]|uniref:Leucine-rich repeat-containing serine/threonine-protein kinase n=1 Tax=Endosaccharibacter trunci TaxID=2812733 RepID=A0ABT1W808_9PROT|nr:leucine-rich repeat-containing serine/threonine-protein kinase [Acetobacteraceae bacterium KSS8]